MLFIVVLCHISAYQDCKHCWLYGLSQEYGDCCGDLASVPRFVSLKPALLLPFGLLLHDFRGERTGIDFADSTRLVVCHNTGISRNRVCQGMARRGRTAMGWFFGCTLHLLIHHKGQIMAFRMTDGSRDDHKPLEDMTAAL